MFYEQLKFYRKKAGLTQIQLAKKLNVSNGTVGMWETGDREPDINTVRRIAILLGITTDQLMCHTMLGTYIKHRRGDESVEEFAQKCGVSKDLILGIENGFSSPKDRGDLANLRTCIGTDELDIIACNLDVDPLYLYCLADGYNPHKIKNVNIPSDDLTKNLHTLIDINLSLFNGEESVDTPPSDISSAEMELIYAYRCADTRSRQMVDIALEPYKPPVQLEEAT